MILPSNSIKWTFNGSKQVISVKLETKELSLKKVERQKNGKEK